MPSRSRAGLAWLVFLVTFACLLGGLVVTLLVTRPLTVDALVDGAVEGAMWLLFAIIGLVLTLRRPGNPIGWLTSLDCCLSATCSPTRCCCHSRWRSRWRCCATGCGTWTAWSAGPSPTPSSPPCSSSPTCWSSRPPPRLAGNSGSLAVAAATLSAAAAFAPLRRQVQDMVDRRFNRRRYDAARTVDRFAVRLRDQVDLDALRAELLTVVDQTVQPTQASLWLRAPAATRPSADRNAR